MLSEKERKTLDDIERHLYLEDPKLAHALVHGSSKDSGQRRWPYTVALTATLVLLVLALIFALSILAFAAAVLAGGVLGVQWLHREWRSRRPERDRNANHGE